MKSLEFFKRTLATTLAIVLALLLSVRPLLALGPHGYIVTLRQVGPDVVATGSGSIDLTGLTFFQRTSLSPAIHPRKYLGKWGLWKRLYLHGGGFFQGRLLLQPYWVGRESRGR